MIPTRSGRKVSVCVCVCVMLMYQCVVSGGRVRVDTTLLGFHNLSWQRGHQSLVFEVTSKCAPSFPGVCDSSLPLL